MVTKLFPTSAAGNLVHSPALTRVREAGLVPTGTLSLILISQITIPLPFTSVPITMGTFAALGAGAAFGSRRGVLSASLLGVLAAVGAPALADRSSGAVVTFGYVIGYILIVATAGRAVIVWLRYSGSTVTRVVTGIALMLLASALVYIPGLTWLKVATGAGWGTTLYLGLVPFIVGDILRSAAATGLLPVRSRLRRPP